MILSLYYVEASRDRREAVLLVAFDAIFPYG